MGIVSPRKIERACYEYLAFRVLTGNQQPDHSRISEFRRRNLDAQRELAGRQRRRPRGAVRSAALGRVLVTAGGDPEVMAQAVWDRSMALHAIVGSLGRRLRSLFPRSYGI